MRDMRRWIIGGVVLVLAAWFLPDLVRPYRNVANLKAPGEKVVVLGDSIPAGFGEGVGPDRAWPALVSRRLGVPIVNQSISGDTTEKGLARLQAVLDERPRLVIVELGGNDMFGKVGADSMKSNLEKIFTAIHASGAMVAYASVPAPLAQEYDDAWVEACKAHGVWYVRNILKGVITDSRLMLDSIHPNAAGNEVIADRMAPEIQRLLEAGNRAR